jgi:predicted Ser/Thr protein kinase
MKRRSLLKNLTVAAGGLLSLPAWASGWSPESIGQTHVVPVADENLLAEIVETFIPETDTPGAKSLKVHQFVLRMVNDCYGEPAQESLQQGLATTEQVAKQAFQKSFMECDASQRKQILVNLKDSSEPGTKRFAEMVKSLTIRGYMNSQYVMVNILKYNMAPGFYYGCVPVKT